jgi:hypothetical protein
LPTRSRPPSSRQLAAIAALAAVLAAAGAPQLARAQTDAQDQAQAQVQVEAETPPALWPEQRGWEAGARYWWSQGKTQWSHNAQGVDRRLGNPTSVLVYDHLYAHSIEFQGAKYWRQGWFITGNVGVGQIYKGNLNDADFNAGQVETSETNSTINDGQLGYLTVDGGYNLWRFPGGSTIGLFGGLQYWTEQVDANGASFVVPRGATGVGSGVNVITNEVHWASVRTGVAVRTQLSEKFRLVAQVAAVPYTSMTNDDSHHLRPDLGSTPNITMDGTGYGYQLDAEVRYRIYKLMELGLGARYWKLKADGNVTFARSTTLPLNDFESTRYGLTLSLINRW